MKNIQYTVRGIHPLVDKELRRKARASRRSLNEVTLDVLQKALGINKSDLSRPSQDLAGLAAFDQAAKCPSPYDPNRPIKDLYRESIKKKYGY